MLQTKGQNREVYFFKVILDNTSMHWYPTLSHTNIVFVPHLVNWNLVPLAVDGFRELCGEPRTESGSGSELL